ncbi:MAG: 4-hydroxy-tetrahydrodipicolinate reductase [Thermoanaerobaculia bacterium]|nr:4-hydroxy-tetrahydrodipicolinate reductase [Thermoanaerobaculia bacterium]MCK6684322.1 4-hydroxy-tetrahydrodipicolinate reductase [Thermoanaerobaculia bacterium]
MKALIVGYGRMGRAIESHLIQRGHTVAGRVDIDSPISDQLAGSVDVAIEFTIPEAAPKRIENLLERGVPVVSGTTGFDVAPLRALADHRGVAFLHSANYSIGIAAMKRAVMVLAGVLESFSEFEPGIFERHHSLKLDSPSGTAKLLAAAVEAARTLKGPEVPIAALRQGGQPGEHTVYFEGPEEVVAITHQARSRAIFAQGAVRAAEWMIKSGRTGSLTFDDFFERRGA